MTDIRKLAFVGLMSLGLATVGSAGCSSSSSTTGTGGSTGTGGVGTGTGGSHTGGSTGTGGSATGGAAGGTAAACPAAPTNGLIADFMGDAGIEIMGGVTTYGGTGAPTFTIADNAVTVMENFASGASPDYVGTVLYFNTCIDASAFTGIQFDLSGSTTGCTIQYSANDAPHDDMTSDPKGTCTLGAGMCYSPQAAIAAPTSTVMTIMQPWIATAGGSPSQVLDPKQLTGIQWQFTIPAATDAGANVCMANMKITNVKFYK
jgi:hypothetical protein